MDRSAYSWNRFTTPSLSIVAGLAGASHRFMFEGRNTRVRLPAADRAGSDDDSRLYVTTRRTVDHVPLVFDVHDVDVIVDQPASPEILAILQSDKNSVVPDGLVSAMGDFAERGFNNWLRVMRWRTRHWSIGRLRRHQRATWGTYLHEQGTDRILAPSVTTIKVAADRPIAVQEWEDVQSVLTLGAQAPLFYDLYFDGMEHLVSEDFRRAVVDFANACEVLLKTLLDQGVPQALIAPAREFLLRAQASVLLNRFGPALLDMERSSKVGQHRVALEQLFAARNDVLHSHRPDALTHARCVQFSIATEVLLEAGAKALSLP
jgi:hypothetical protein